MCEKSRQNLYGGNYVAVESASTTTAGGTLEGKLALQMITSDDLWRYTHEFLGPSKKEDDDDESDDDDEKDEEDEDAEGGGEEKETEGK